MENKPNNEISELLARLQQKVEKKSEPKVDSVKPKEEESTEALLSLLKKNIGASEKARVSSGNEEYDIQGYELVCEETLGDDREETVTRCDVLMTDVAELSEEDKEVLQNRVAELVTDSLEADETLEILVPIDGLHTDKDFAEVAETLESNPSEEMSNPSFEELLFTEEDTDDDNVLLEAPTYIAERDTEEIAEEKTSQAFGKTYAQNCLHEAMAKRFFDGRNSDVSSLVDDEVSEAADFDDVDINLALALGSRAALEDSVGYVRVRSAKNGFYDPFWEEATAENTYGYRGEEFRSYEQVDGIKKHYASVYRKLKKQFIVTFVLSVLILLLEHLPMTPLRIPYLSEWMTLPGFYYGLAALLSGLLVLVSLKTVLRGLRNLLRLRAEPFVAVSFLAVLNFLYTFTIALFARYSGLPVYNFTVSVLLLFGIADDGVRLMREKLAFDVVSEQKTKLSLERFEGNGESVFINAAAPKKDFFVEKIDFVGNFFTRSGRRPVQFVECIYELSFSFLGALLISLVALYLGQSISSVWALFVFSVLVCLPMQFLILGIYPFFHLTKGLSKLDSAVIGDAVTDEYNDADTIYLEDTEMFGKHGARIVGLRVYNDMEFYEILSYALSVFSLVGAPLCNVFDNSVKEIEKKDGIKITGVSVGGLEASEESGNLIYVGNLAFMRSCGYFPKRNLDDEKKMESGQISILYMAIGGELCAKIYMQYTVTQRFEKFAAEMIKNGIRVGIRTLDPNVNEKMIAALRNDSEISIKVIRPTPNELIPIGKHSDSGIVTSKNSHMIFKILEQCFNIKRIHTVQRRFRIGALVLGVIISLLAMLFDFYRSIPSLYLVIYQLLWFLPSLIYTKSKLK